MNPDPKNLDPDPAFQVNRDADPVPDLNIFLIENCNLFIPVPPKRTSMLREKPSALKREHPAHQKMKFITFFQFSPLLDPDPDCKIGFRNLILNPDPIRIWIHNAACND